MSLVKNLKRSVWKAPKNYRWNEPRKNKWAEQCLKVFVLKCACRHFTERVYSLT